MLRIKRWMCKETEIFAKCQWAFLNERSTDQIFLIVSEIRSSLLSHID